MEPEANEYATEPVPDSSTVGWLRVAMISAMVAFSLPTFLTGLEVAAVYSAADTAIILLTGTAILTLLGCITGGIGAATRLSSYMLNRIAFGEYGAALVNIAFAISLLGWFGVNIDLFSDAVLRLSREMFSAEIPAWVVELFAGALMTVTTFFGFRAINLLSTLLVPVLMVVTVQLIAGSLDALPFTELMQRAAAGNGSFGNGVSAVVGGIIVGTVILPDITRFLRHWRHAAYGVILSYFLVSTIVMAAGAIASTALADHDLLNILLTLGIGWAAFAVVIFGSWVLNSLNLYSTMLSVESTLPRLNNRALILVCGALGTVAAFFNILDYFLEFLFYLSIAFVPVSGVIAVDYCLCRRNAFHGARIGQLQQARWSAIVAWLAGATVALMGSWGWFALSSIAALDAVLVASALYYLLQRGKTA
ncbi:cytosine permease [Parahaliea aestuarii]|uniref:Cytosine permease n=1 Tax=Parahaliea aestuarii TaxID=1852021 RepID=A0A5C8ZWD7_9GAMM|nr:cytosine permease [Parahaliea aestuarii]TXS91561.1 cytosine permease [Parahaliea aestuarii]